MVEVEEDGDLAQAKHRIRVLEREFREQAERMAKLERKVLVAVELAAHHHEEADRMRRLRDRAALEHAEERRFRHEAEAQEASLRADLAWATKEMATLRATAEDYAVRQEAIRRALDAAGVVAVEAAGAVPADERVRRLAAARDAAVAEKAKWEHLVDQACVAVGEGLFAGGATLVEAIERKCAALESSLAGREQLAAEAASLAAVRDLLEYEVEDLLERTYRTLDHACAECVPGGPLTGDGFRCALHRARALVADPPAAGQALLDQVERLRWVVEEWERWREAGPGEGPMPRRGDAKEALGEVDPRNAEAWARRLAESR